MQEDKVVIRRGSFGALVGGIVLGSLIGGTLALLMAPDSGMRTRSKIAERGNDIRDRAKEAVEDTRGRVMDVTTNARSRVQQVVANVRKPSSDRTLEGEVDQLNRDTDILEADINKSYDL